MCASDNVTLPVKSSDSQFYIPYSKVDNLTIGQPHKGFAGIARLASRLGVAPGDDGVIAISDEDGVMYPLIPLIHAFLDKLETHDG